MNYLMIDNEIYGFAFALMEMPSARLLLSGEITGIEAGIATFNYQFANQEHQRILKTVETTDVAVRILASIIAESGLTVNLIGHRVVHGASKYKKPARIDKEVLADISEYIDYAPMHNYYNLKNIQSTLMQYPEIPQYVIFDTAYYQNMPPKAFLYGIPYELSLKYNIRRYGFHGISHSYLARHSSELAEKDQRDLKIISCHLGHGCSITAIKNGFPVDTSMGFSPLEGLIMEKRSGDINLDLLMFLQAKEDMDFKELETMLYNFSGLFGMSGQIGTIREIMDKYKERDPIAMNAVNTFVYRIVKYIGSYYLVMKGVDLLVFTGILIKNEPWLRDLICSGLDFIGLEIDKEKNNELVGDHEGEISTSGSKVKAFYIKQEVALEMAHEIWTEVQEAGAIPNSKPA